MDLTQRHEAHLVPRAEIERRIRAYQEALGAAGVGLAWLDYPSDLLYLTGSIQTGVLLVPRDQEPVWFVRRSPERARWETPLRVEPFPGGKGLVAAARDMLPGGEALGMSLDVLPAGMYLKVVRGLGQVEIRDVSPLLKAQRARKSGWELARIRDAARQAEVVFSEMATHVAGARRELDVSASIEHRLRLLGHGGTVRIRRQGLELSMIYAVAGDGALYPTNFDGPVGGEGLYHSTSAGAGWREIRSGETLMVDMVTSVGGYHADDARTFLPKGELPREAARAHDLCLGALDRLEGAMRPGRTCSDVYQEVMAWVRDQGEPEGFMGFGGNRVKFLGHGVGLELDEWPIVAPRVDMILEEGMVVALEPKAFLQGVGPVGAENTYVLTPDGCESLCSSPREIQTLA